MSGCLLFSGGQQVGGGVVERDGSGGRRGGADVPRVARRAARAAARPAGALLQRRARAAARRAQPRFVQYHLTVQPYWPSS